MCGILGVIAPLSSTVDLSDDQVAAMRDRMAHRGPDGAGLWRCASAVLAHRRLAVIDLSTGGAQPMASGDGRRVLVYNGELYNDLALRQQLASRGHSFTSTSDTQTLMASMAEWREDAASRLRGMYAFGYLDLDAGTLTLARDQLGIKPLYYTRVRADAADHIVFASEIPPLLMHPGVRAAPDPVVVSSYLTTIRTTLGHRTMYAGISTVMPGEWIVFDLRRPNLPERRTQRWRGPDTEWEHTAPPDIDGARAVIRASVHGHLRSDVPVCCLLSGGLDSSIVCIAAAERLGGERLTTFCSGARGPGGAMDDFAAAGLMSAALGSRHVECPVTRGDFAERWPWMIEQTGVPVSTPNEIAINEVARRLRSEGDVVALSGEGADELFGGYDASMRQLARHFDDGGATGRWRDSGGVVQLRAAEWIPLDAKSQIVSERLWSECEADHALLAWYRDEFIAAAASLNDDQGLAAHLRFQRRVNLQGLLLRLDQATMQESVEGRTPLADASVADFSERLPMSLKFDASIDGVHGTKIALRRAFEQSLPRAIVGRPKASFPLPFQEWCVDRAGVLRTSSMARELFTQAAIETVASNASQLWQLAWPMINVALWGRRFE